MVKDKLENGCSSGMRRVIGRPSDWVGAVILFILLALAARGAEDTPKKSQFECIGSFGEGIGSPAVQGHIVYTAGGYVVRAVDIRDPQHPKVLGWVRMQQPIINLEARGPAVYVAMENGRGVWLVDASDPAHLRRVKGLGGGNRETTVRLMGDFLYIYSEGKWGAPGYSVLHITDPLHPEYVDGGSARGYEHRAFATNGKRLYAMHKNHEDNNSITLVVEDCTKKPAKEILKRHYDESEIPGRLDLDIKSGQVWLGEPELKNRALVGKLELTSEAWCISHEDKPKDWYFQFNGPWILSPYGNDDTGDEGYTLFHRSRMAEPVLKLQKKPTEYDKTPMIVHSMLVNMIGNYLYVDEDEHHTVYPLQDPTHLTGVTRENAVNLSDVCLADPKTALSNSWQDGLKIYDTSNPVHWTERGVYRQALEIENLKVVDRVAYAVGERRLSIVDCHKPELPVQIGGCDLPSTVSTCAVENDTVYAGGDEGKIYAVDVRKPAQPVVRGAGTLPKVPQAMAASGNRLFVANGEAGLQVVDTSDPARMKIIGHYQTPEPCVDLATSGTLVFALTRQTLCVLDASGSSAPTLMCALPYRSKDEAEYDDDYDVFYIKRLGTALYLIRSHGGQDMRTGVEIVNVTNPAAPRLMDDGINNSEDGDEEPAPKPKKTPARPDPNSKTAGWLLGIPFSSHSTDGTEYAMEFYDLSDPLHPVYVDGWYSRSECRQSILYKDILYKQNMEGGGVMILRRVGNTARESIDKHPE